VRLTALIIFVLLLGSMALLGADRTTTRAQGATPASDATPASGATAACPSTTPEENVALVQRWYEEVLNQQDLDVIDDILAEDYVRYRAGIPFANESGTADDVQWVEMILAEFPDVTFSIEDIFADGDKVAVRTITSGTHTGPMVDMGSAPASQRQMARENIAIWRVACGKLSEQWIVQDNLGMLRQLGVITDVEMVSVGTRQSRPQCHSHIPLPCGTRHPAPDRQHAPAGDTHSAPARLNE
jgi:predicted ester cyclase